MTRWYTVLWIDKKGNVRTRLVRPRPRFVSPKIEYIQE